MYNTHRSKQLLSVPEWLFWTRPDWIGTRPASGCVLVSTRLTPQSPSPGPVWYLADENTIRTAQGRVALKGLGVKRVKFCHTGCHACRPVSALSGPHTQIKTEDNTPGPLKHINHTSLQLSHKYHLYNYPSQHHYFIIAAVTYYSCRPFDRVCGQEVSTQPELYG